MNKLRAHHSSDLSCVSQPAKDLEGGLPEGLDSGYLHLFVGAVCAADGGPIRHHVNAWHLLPNDAALQASMDGSHLARQRANLISAFAAAVAAHRATALTVVITTNEGQPNSA